FEIDRNRAADRAGGLVKQAGRLAEKDVLGILADLGKFDLVEQFGVFSVIFAAEDRSDADLKRGRARKAETAQHIAGGKSVKPADLAAAPGNTGRHAADQRGAVLRFGGLRGQDRKVDVVDLAKSFRDE